MTDAVATETRSQNEFLCVDSAPKQYASLIPIWRAPAACALFLVIGFAAIFIVNQIPFLNAAFPDDDFIFSPYTGSHSIPIRLFIVTFSASFCCFCNGDLKNKTLLFADIVFTYALYCAVFDLINIIVYETLQVRYQLSFIEIVSGLLGFWVFSLKLLRRGRMPPKIEVPYKPQRTFSTIVRLVGGAVAAGLFSFWIASLDLAIVQDLRNFALLGGIGPGVFLFLPVLFLIWFVLATYDRLTMKVGDFTPPLTFVVPAHNEEYIIADTIFAMDEAACNYNGNVIILIMNNNSDDRTSEVAEAALAKCKAATGKVIDVPKPGKSNALNAGLAAAETEFFVRVDADTLIAPDSIHRAMRYFYDPKVGVVGGLPIPPGGALFDNARFLEVIVKHGYYSVALGAINGVVGVPGMLALYRTELPRQLGGFVEGMNGEDTDMSLRIGEMGYEVVVDPKVTYISEVPASYKHMREQRMRWFRSIYHISSRNGDYLDRSWLTIRGKIILPYMLVNSARRAMLTPLVMFGAIEYVTSFNSANTLEWQAILAVLIGAPAIVAVFASLINGYPKGILALPDYLVFRAIRAYLTLESLLSIIIAPDPETVARAQVVRRKRKVWIARARAGFAGAVLSVAAIFNANANDPGLLVEATMGAQRQGLIVEEDDVKASGLAVGVFADASLIYDQRLRKKDFVKVKSNLRKDIYPDRSGLDTIHYRGELQYRRQLSKKCSCWLQATMRYDQKKRDGEFLFRREAAQVKLWRRHNKQHNGFIQLGASNLDYNDARLAGFDQRRYRIDVGHQWRPADSRLRLNGVIFAEHSDADAARFDFQSLGAQLRAERQFASSATKMHVALFWRERRYEGVFSRDFPMSRSDRALRASVGLSHPVRKRLTVTGALGWEQNRSNIPIRRHQGLTFRITLSAKLPILD